MGLKKTLNSKTTDFYKGPVWGPMVSSECQAYWAALSSMGITKVTTPERSFCVAEERAKPLARQGSQSV